MTSAQTLGEWFDDGMDKGATHMVVRCDTFDYTDYPVYCSVEEAHRLAFDTSNMQKTMEIYVLDPTLREEQLRPGTRAWHLT